MLTKEVWIPLLRSLITGLLAGVLLFALGALFAWDSPGALAAIGGIFGIPFGVVGVCTASLASPGGRFGAGYICPIGGGQNEQS